MSRTFSDTEKSLIDLFSKNDRFKYKDIVYSVKVVGKPSPSEGECKTDIYILADDDKGCSKEFKISVKQKNADFLENKIQLDRAIEIFGIDAQRIISKSIESVKKNFEDEFIIFFDKKGNTRAKSITLGWRFEILNKMSGKKSGLLKLSYDQKKEVYSGGNLSKDKKNSKILGLPVINSGIANFILIVDPIIKQDLDFYVNRLIPIEDFVKEKELYFCCRALNYRAEKDGWEGDRSLCVYVDWVLKDGKLFSALIYNDPLKKKGNEMAENIREILKTLKITKENFSDLEQFLDKNVNKYKK